jgi:hypothetical protein
MTGSILGQLSQVLLDVGNPAENQIPINHARTAPRAAGVRGFGSPETFER